jgi:hypothetical protein
MEELLQKQVDQQEEAKKKQEADQAWDAGVSLVGLIIGVAFIVWIFSKL